MREKNKRRESVKLWHMFISQDDIIWLGLYKLVVSGGWVVVAVRLNLVGGTGSGGRDVDRSCIRLGSFFGMSLCMYMLPAWYGNIPPSLISGSVQTGLR